MDLDPNISNVQFARAASLGSLAQFKNPFELLGDVGIIREAFETSLDLDPENARALYAYALFHDQLPFLLGGDAGLTIPLIERAVIADSQNIQFRLTLSKMLLKKKRRDDAKTHLEVLLGQDAPNERDEAFLVEARALYQEHFE